MDDYEKIISVLKKDEGKKEYLVFTDLLEKYNNGLKNGFDYYSISFSILFDEYYKTKSNNQEICNYKKKWNEVYCFINRLYDFIDEKYIILKRFKIFSNIIDIDELFDFQKKEWEIRRKHLLNIKPSNLEKLS